MVRLPCYFAERRSLPLAPLQHTSIPFPVKALKLLLKDVQHVEGKKSAPTGHVHEDDGDEEWDDDDPLGDADPVDEFGYLSCQLQRSW